MAEIEVPPYFLCPITLELMKDPVIVSTGITYDRDSIEKWIFCNHHTTCPVTNQALQSLDLTPNITLRRLIQGWCTLNADHGVQRLPTPKPPVTAAQISKLLQQSKSPLLQLTSLQTLKSISSQNQTNKRTLESAGAASVLAAIVIEKTLDLPPNPQLLETLTDSTKACEESLSILYGLQLSDSGIKTLTSPQFIKALTLIMQSGSYESRTYSILLMNSILEASDPNLLINLTSQFFYQLSLILKDQISLKATKSSLKSLILASPWGRNRIKAVESGLVPILIDLLLDTTDRREAEMTLTVLDLLCQSAEGRLELLKHGAGLAVVSKKILRVSGTASGKAIRILHSVTRFSGTNGVLQEMLQIGVVAKLCLILQVDCGSKTRERAREILKNHAKVWRNSPCVPPNLMASYPNHN